MLPMVSAWFLFIESFRFTFRRIGLLLIVSLLWWLLSLPLITWPPATAGLFYVVQRLTDINVSEQTTWRHFFEGFRQYWLVSWQLTAINVALGGVIVVSLLFYLGRSEFALRMISVPVFYILLLWLGVQLYLFPLLIMQQPKQIKLIFKNALILSLRNVSFSLVLWLLLLSMALVISTLTGPLLIMLVAYLAVAQTLALQALLKAEQENESTN